MLGLKQRALRYKRSLDAKTLQKRCIQLIGGWLGRQCLNQAMVLLPSLVVS